MAEEALAPEGTSQVYTSYTVNNWGQAQKIYPHKWVVGSALKTRWYVLLFWHQHQRQRDVDGRPLHI
jgi:hypothetical protein